MPEEKSFFKSMQEGFASGWNGFTNYLTSTKNEVEKEWDEFQDEIDTTSAYDQSIISDIVQQTANGISFGAEAVGSLINNESTRELASETLDEIANSDTYKEMTENIVEGVSVLSSEVNEYLDAHPKTKEQLQHMSQAVDKTIDEGIDYVKVVAAEHPEALRNIGAVGTVAAAVIPVAKGAKLVKKAANLEKLDDMLIHKAPQAKLEIDAKADKIADALGGTVAKAPIKSKERAIEKMMNDYDGKAGELKDLARNTIIVPNDKIDDAVEMLREKGASVKVIDGNNDTLGYSGVNSTLKTESGIRAEIQVNSPEMIYAKEPEDLARTLLGNNKYDDIAGKVGIEGGKGHTYYEVHRKINDETPQKIQIELESKSYYNAVRNHNKDLFIESKHIEVNSHTSDNMNFNVKSPLLNKEALIFGTGVTAAITANKLHENVQSSNTLEQEVLEQRVDSQTYQTLGQTEVQDIQSSEKPFDSVAKAQEIIDDVFPHLASPQTQNDFTNNTFYDNSLPHSVNEYLSQFESQGYENDMGRDID